MWRRIVLALKPALSLKARRRRLGAAAIFEQLAAMDFAAAEAPSTIQHSDPDLGSNRADLPGYLKLVEQEFFGQPEILLVHAKLIVLIRRNYRTEECFALFQRLWDEQSKILLAKLNVRWLLSANDTFLDLSTDNEERLIAGWSVILANTVKLSETERLYQSNTCDPERFAAVKHKTEELFDGMRSFWIGREDTLHNMRRRLETNSRNTPTNLIFWELFARMQEHDTVYSRFRDLHEKPRTRWW
jgi:hypothetical protein